MIPDPELKQILTNYKTIAVVGLSPNADRPSYMVASFLKKRGFHIIPVNPLHTDRILGERCFPNLLEAARHSARKIEIVDIFRKSELVMPHVEEAMMLHTKLIWMQEGVENSAAAKIAQAQKIPVVMNRCLMKEYRRLFGVVQ